MSKTKQWAWDTAEKMSNVDNLDLVGIDEYNVDEVLIMAREDYWKKANKEGRSA